MNTLRIRTEDQGSGPSLVLEGELDLSSAGELEGELSRVEKEGPALIVMDLRKLSFIDSSGLRVLLLARKRADEAGRRLVLVRGPKEVQRVLDVTGTDERFEIVEDPASAGGSQS